jgi:5-methylcytosine-specific restriction protein B
MQNQVGGFISEVPSNITKEHIQKAIERIDAEGIEKGAQSSTYDVLFKGNRYPPKLVVSWANEFANGKVLDRQSFSGGLKSANFRVLNKAGFEIVEKESSILKIAEQFINDANSGNQKTKHYPKSYKGLKVKASFGQGALAKVPWVAFLKEGEEVQKGIYPVLLLYKKLGCLVLSYGISKTTPPESSWNIVNKQTTSDYLKEKYRAIPYFLVAVAFFPIWEFMFSLYKHHDKLTALRVALLIIAGISIYIQIET